MAYPRKIEEALEILDAAGVTRQRAATPIHKLLWTLGVEVKPPLFSNFFANAAFFGVGFGVKFTVLMAAVDRYFDPDRLATSFLIQCAGTTIFYTLISAAMIQRRAGKLSLPDWSEIGIADRFD